MRTVLIFALSCVAALLPVPVMGGSVGSSGAAAPADLSPAGEFNPSEMNPAAAGEGNRDVNTVLQRYFETGKSNVVRGATMVARFAGKLPKLGREATLQAKRIVLPDGSVEYDVIGRDGDKTVQKDLIARYMGAEMESSLHPSEDLAINEKNYKFKVKGLQSREGAQVQVIELNPRKKRAGLFKGEIWLDPETGLTLCETGRFVKSPSVFLKKVEFSRKYRILEGKSVPVTMATQIQTRFWGMAELEVEYTDVQLTAPAKETATTQGKKEDTKLPEERQYLAN